jgi:hypothetical protein
MRLASAGFCSTHRPVKANAARIPEEPNTSRIADVLPASEPASKVSATACCDVSPIQTTAAEPAGGVVNGVDVVEVDAVGGGDSVVVLGASELEVVGSEVEGGRDVLDVVDEVLGASDVVLVDGAIVVGTAVDVTGTELVVVVAA